MTAANTSEPRRASRVPWLLIAVAALMLASGVCVYVFDRPPGTAYMLPQQWTRFSGGASGFWQALGGSWPTFAHAFSFSLITCLVLPPRAVGFTAACLGWFVVEGLFEIAQHPASRPGSRKRSRGGWPLCRCSTICPRNSCRATSTLPTSPLPAPARCSPGAWHGGHCVARLPPDRETRPHGRGAYSPALCGNAAASLTWLKPRPCVAYGGPAPP